MREKDKPSQSGTGKEDQKSAAFYRYQIEQSRRALVTSQENAKMKQEKMEAVVLELRKERDAIRKDLEVLKEIDKINNNTDSKKIQLEREIKNTLEWVQKANGATTSLIEQNTKFRQAVMQMRKGTIRGFWNRMRQPNPNPPNGNATNKAEAQVASNPNKRNENQSALKSDK